VGPPPDEYVGPGRYEAERWAVFAREWVALGDSGRVARPGAYVADTVAGFPLVVVNDGGRLHTLANVCRHRGGPLVPEGEGTVRSLVCRYHGWAYGLDGTLRSARDFGAPVPPGCDLTSGRAAVWRGLLFATLDPEAPDLEDWLGAVVTHAAPFPLEAMEVRHRCAHDLAANWKVYAENYQEGYHIPLVHPGLNRQVDAGRYRVDLKGPVARHRAPVREGAATEGAWLWRFPGTALNLYPSGYSLESAWPTGPTGTRVHYTFSFLPDTPDAEVEAAVASSVGILEEDRAICEAVQRNLASGLARPGLLSPRHEAGVALVHRLVARALAGPAAGRPFNPPG
jgi:choline monooxygenase